jgi:hypothetical protein
MGVQASEIWRPSILEALEVPDNWRQSIAPLEEVVACRTFITFRIWIQTLVYEWENLGTGETPPVSTVAPDAGGTRQECSYSALALDDTIPNGLAFYTILKEGLQTLSDRSDLLIGEQARPSK